MGKKEVTADGLDIRMVRVKEPKGRLISIGKPHSLENGYWTESYVEIDDNGMLCLSYRKMCCLAGKAKWYVTMPVFK